MQFLLKRDTMRTQSCSGKESYQLRWKRALTSPASALYCIDSPRISNQETEKFKESYISYVKFEVFLNFLTLPALVSICTVLYLEDGDCEQPIRLWLVIYGIHYATLIPAQIA